MLLPSTSTPSLSTPHSLSLPSTVLSLGLDNVVCLRWPIADDISYLVPTVYLSIPVLSSPTLLLSSTTLLLFLSIPLLFSLDLVLLSVVIHSCSLAIGTILGSVLCLQLVSRSVLVLLCSLFAIVGSV